MKTFEFDRDSIDEIRMALDEHRDALISFLETLEDEGGDAQGTMQTLREAIARTDKLIEFFKRTTAWTMLPK